LGTRGRRSGLLCSPTLILPLSLEFGIFGLLELRSTQLASVRLLLQTFEGLEEEFLAFLVEDFAQIDEFLRIFPLLVPREDMQSEELDDAYSCGQVFRRICTARRDDVALLGIGGCIETVGKVEVRLSVGGEVCLQTLLVE
jgi:hypothetical protein